MSSHEGDSRNRLVSARDASPRNRPSWSFVGNWLPWGDQRPRTWIVEVGGHRFEVPLNLVYQLGTQALFLYLLELATGGNLIRWRDLCTTWGVALLADNAFSLTLRRARFRVLSTIAAGNTLLLFFAGNAVLLGMSSAVMIAVKHLVRGADGRHLFNPGAVGVFVCGMTQVILPSSGIVSVSHVFNLIPYANILITCVGLPQLLMSNRLVYTTSIVGAASLSGYPPAPPLLAIFFFAATDPMTSPRTIPRQILFGIIAGPLTLALHVIFFIAGEPAKVAGLLLTTALAERWRKRRVEAWFERRLTGLGLRRPSAAFLRTAGAIAIVLLGIAGEIRSPWRDKEIGFDFVDAKSGAPLSEDEIGKLAAGGFELHNGVLVARLHRQFNTRWSTYWDRPSADRFFSPNAPTTVAGALPGSSGDGEISLASITTLRMASRSKLGFIEAIRYQVVVDTDRLR